jgi:hypothetical protein
MISKAVTDYLRDLANRLEIIVDSGLCETADIRQLIDLADTLDEEREKYEKRPHYTLAELLAQGDPDQPDESEGRERND